MFDGSSDQGSIVMIIFRSPFLNLSSTSSSYSISVVNSAVTLNATFLPVMLENRRQLEICLFSSTSLGKPKCKRGIKFSTLVMDKRCGSEDNRGVLLTGESEFQRVDL